ncbi:MAG: hypothetical protein FWE13_04955 [Firmicutes bacterium]|nr:hypothetical protein [Bacillota bacterium]
MLKVDFKKSLEEILKSYKDVEVIQIERLGLKRYCLNTKPFVVFSESKNGDQILHIKLPSYKCYELILRFSNLFRSSEIYVSNRWLCFTIADLHKITTQVDIQKLLLLSYKTTFNELTIWDKQKYLSAISIKYDNLAIS